ncbi:MAG: hypothetical protein ABIF82_09640 [Planctomycetota bacterium]
MNALLGIGGGVIVVPALVFFAGWEFVTRTPSATLRVLFAIALALIGLAIIARAKRTSKAGYAPDWVI